MADIVQEVLREVDNLRDELIELCRSLVRINTINPYAGPGPLGSEKPGQEFLEPILREMGGKTRLFEPPPDIFDRMGVIGPKDRSWKDRPNLVTEFTLGADPRLGKRILINSHMDTVGAPDMAFDPFCADVKDGRIYGRGSSDDKGGMTMGVIAIKAALKFADELCGTIVHESVVDEECNGSGAGTLACGLEGYTGDEAIVIDGQNLTITRGCQGCLTARVTVHGKAGHAATGGVNAIDKGMLVKQAIDRFKAEREAKYPGCLLNLGIFNAGTHPAVVPGLAEMHMNIVYSSEEAAASDHAGKRWGAALVREALLDVLRRADASDDWLRDHRSAVEWVKDLVPFETPAEAPVVRNLTEAYETALSEAPRVDVMPAWADAANIVRYSGVPAVLFGPGTNEAAHSQDETVLIDDIVRGAKVVAAYLCRQLAK